WRKYRIGEIHPSVTKFLNQSALAWTVQASASFGTPPGDAKNPGPSQLGARLMLLSRLGTVFSVRTRLTVLSLVPVVGLLAIGLAYVASERTVESAFESVHQSSRLANASREFKDALTAMQLRTREFVAQPQPFLISRFEEAHASAL